MLQMQSTPDTSAPLPNKTMARGKESAPENEFSKILHREVSGKKDKGDPNNTPAVTKPNEKKIKPEKTASPQPHSNHPTAPKHEHSNKVEHPRQHAAHATPASRVKARISRLIQEVRNPKKNRHAPKGRPRWRTLTASPR